MGDKASGMTRIPAPVLAVAGAPGSAQRGAGCGPRRVDAPF